MLLSVCKSVQSVRLSIYHAPAYKRFVLSVYQIVLHQCSALDSRRRKNREKKAVNRRRNKSVGRKKVENRESKMKCGREKKESEKKLKELERDLCIFFY